jgi:hypothetical protein
MALEIGLVVLLQFLGRTLGWCPVLLHSFLLFAAG